MSFTVLSFVIIFMFAMVACVEIYRGVHRGFLLSLVTLGNIVLSLLLTFALMPLLTNLIAKLAVKLINTVRVYKNFAQILPTLDSVVQSVVEMLVGSVLFVFIFFVLRIVLSWLLGIIYKLCTIRKSDDPGYGRDDHSCASRESKMRGGFCGFVSALLITMIIVSPVMGTLELANSALTIVGNASNKAISTIGKGNVAEVKNFSNDIVGNAFYRCGGRWIYNNAASTMISGQRAELLAEVETIEAMSGDMLLVYGIFQKPQEATQEHIAALERLREKLPDLTVCERLIGDVIRQCATAWKQGNSFLTVKRPAMNSFVEPTFLQILEECSNTTSYNAEQNADTILEIYGILLESGVFSMKSGDYEQILQQMTEHDTIKRVDQALKKNPHIENIETSAIVMNVFVSYLDGQKLSDSQYNELMNGLAIALNTVNSYSNLSDDLKEKELARHLQTAMSEQGIHFSLSMAETLSEQLLNEFSGTGISAENVKSLIKKYKNG